MADDRTEAEMISDVRSLLNEPSALGVSNADITAFLDTATMEVAIKANLLRTSDVTFDLVGSATYDSAQGEYTIRAASGDINILASLHKIYHVMYLGSTATDGSDATYSNAKGLIKIHPRQIQHVAVPTVGIPIYWYWTTSYGQLPSPASYDVIGVWPRPSAAANGKLIKIFYSRTYDEYDTAATINLPEWAQDICVWYAYAKCLERDGKFAQANQYMSYFNNTIMFMRSDIIQDEVDSKDMMTVPDYTRVAQ